MKPTGNLVADTICRTAEIGLAITGAADGGPLTIIGATPVAVIGVCPDCGQPGKLRNHTTRRLVDLPVVGFPTRLHVTVPRFRCTATSCKRKIFQDTPTLQGSGTAGGNDYTDELLLETKDMCGKPILLRRGWFNTTDQAPWGYDKIVEHPGAVALQVAVFKLVARPLGHHAQGVGEAAADSFSAHLRGERAAQQLAELEGGLAPQRFGVDEGAVHVPEDGLGPTQVPEAR